MALTVAHIGTYTDLLFRSAENCPHFVNHDFDSKVKSQSHVVTDVV